jgi:hypothetical protein
VRLNLGVPPEKAVALVANVIREAIAKYGDRAYALLKHMPKSLREDIKQRATGIDSRYGRR